MPTRLFGWCLISYPAFGFPGEMTTRSVLLVPADVDSTEKVCCRTRVLLIVTVMKRFGWNLLVTLGVVNDTR